MLGVQCSKNLDELTKLRTRSGLEALASQRFQTLLAQRPTCSGYSKIIPVATDMDSRPGAMLMAGERKGCFLKAKGVVTLGSARKSFLFS